MKLRHEDGSVKLWDTSGLGLTLLHKLKTHKLFDKRKDMVDASDSESPYKISAITVFGCYLALAAVGGHVTLYKYYSKVPADEELADIPVKWPFRFFSSALTKKKNININIR